MSAHRYIGVDTPRPEGGDKVAGRAHYIHDMTRPGMLYGKIKFSEHAHARILSIDTSRAERLPGVRAVITAYDTPEVRIGILRDNFALKRDKVRQFRDEVAAVAAIDPDIAAEAVDLIRVEYEPLPAVFDPIEALEEDAPLIHDADARGRPVTSNLVPMPCQHLTGDIAEGERASAHIVEGEFSTPLIQQCCLGTAGSIAEFDTNDHLTIWAKTQIPFLAQRDYVRALGDMGLPGKNARVIVPAMGGGFGTGLDTHAYEYISILLAHRPTVMLLPVTSLYRVPHVRFGSTLAYTNNTYCQAMRGYGNPEVSWAIESNLDELAEAAGIDRLELRLRNCNEPGETTPMGLKVTTCGLRECLERTAKGLDWNAERDRSGTKRRGVGMASLIHTGGGGRIYRSDGSGMILKFDDFGNVNVYHGGVEMGQGLHSTIALSVAEALGVKPESVHINQTDTGTCPWDVGTHASRGAFMAGNSAILAAREAREKIFALAEGLFADLARKSLAKYARAHPDEPPPEDFDLDAACRADQFDLREGEVFLSDAPDVPWLRVPLGRLLRAAHFRERGEMLTVSSFYDPPNELPDWETGVGNMSATYAYGTQGVEVEVDTETGEVTILKMVAAHDVGKILNPQTLEGQIYGAVAQGVGYALTEEVKTEKGRILNPGFTDYKIPTVHEMSFPIQLELIETDDPEGPFGAKGVGEPGLVPTAPAIANAIVDAIGVRVRHLPITPEKILGLD